MTQTKALLPDGLKLISADSHITEPPDCYVAHIDPAFRDRAPRLQHDPERGDIFVVPGIPKPVPMGLVAAAGKPADELRMSGARFEELHRGGWDPKARLADQDRDGVGAEIIYPTVGMLMCSHPDLPYRQACFQAYNRWLEGFCKAAPDRLYGIGQTGFVDVPTTIRDMHAIKEAGFKGVMMPGDPPEHDFDHPMYDPVWQTAVELDLPLSFHILTTRSNDLAGTRGPRINGFQAIIRGNQDILGTFIFGGVFDRHPGLKLVCVEADAGWAPHYMYRMDHAYKRHRHWMKGRELKRLPSEYFRDHIYLTFQDDWTAFRMADMVNVERLMWANDFPHSDSTWPWSQEILEGQVDHLSDTARRRILRDNVVELYGLAN
jgi:predicted TIM-barrel fold metal-dependent hydrolase